ncbi:unnamed protein product, partial [Staurois parvus]
MAVLYTAIQSSVAEPTRRRTVDKQNSPPRWRSSVITRRQLNHQPGPVPLVQCQCFLLALITVLVSLGMSVIPNQFHPVSECPPQSRY